MSGIRTRWEDELNEAEDQAERMTAHGGQPSDFESAAVAALLAIAKQGEYVITQRSNRELDLRLAALGAAVGLFGSTLRLAASADWDTVMADLLKSAETFAKFLGAPSGQA